ncbi:MAG: hypothetical protein ACOX0N_04275 [Syntrophomonadaceae bacterium]|jgi:hypothetical protein
MDLMENPFYKLGATIRDNRRQLHDLADEASLIKDHMEIEKALSELTKPKNRLSAEVAWLLGIAPKRASAIINVLMNEPLKSLDEEQNLPPISRANMIATMISRLAILSSKFSSNVYADIVEFSFVSLIDAHDQFNSEALLHLINEERLVSGFPEVADIRLIENELLQRRQYYKQVVKLAMDQMPPDKLIQTITKIVQSSISNYGQCSILLDDIIDTYEIEAQQFLQTEKSNISVLIENAMNLVNSKKSDDILNQTIDELECVVKNWDIVASPIQLSYASRGIDHSDSIEIARSLREFAVEIFNEHGKLEISQRITKLIKDVFNEIEEISEQAAEDINIIQEIKANHAQYYAEKDKIDAKWAKEISYSTKIGLLRSKLEISPEGVLWKNTLWPLDSIRLVRWGATKNYMNGIHAYTDYVISFGNEQSLSTVNTRNGEVYNQFINRLWKAVCTRLLFEFLEGLANSQKYWFSSKLRVDDYGVEIEKSKWFGKKEKFYYKWSDVAIWNEPGKLCIGSKDKKVTTDLSYQYVSNVHILEAAIRAFFKKSSEKMSSLLEAN